MALRELLLKLSVIDESSQKLGEVMAKVHELEAKTITIKTKISDTVVPQLSQVSKATYQTAVATRSLETAYVDAEKAGIKIAAAQNQVKEASQNVSKATGDVTKAIKEVNNNKGLIAEIGQSWKDVKKELQELTLLTGAITMSSVYAVDKVEESLSVITNLRGSEAAESWKAWMEEAKQTSAVTRATIAESTAIYLKAVTTEDQKKLAEYLEKEAIREGKSPEEMAGLIEAIGRGRGAETLKKMPGLEIDYEGVSKKVEALRNNPVWQQQNKGMSEAQLSAKLLTEEIIHYAETVKDTNGKTLAEWEGQAGSLERIRFAFERIGYTLGDSVFPYFEQAIGYLEEFNNVLDDNKASAGIAMIAIATVFAVSTMTLAIGKVAEGLITFARVTRLAAVAQWLLNAAMAANPLVLLALAIVAIIAVVGLLAYKMGWLDGIIKAVMNSPVGGALETAFGTIGDIISALLGDTSALENRLKGLKEWLGTMKGQQIALTFAMAALGPLGGYFALASKLLETTKGGSRTLDIMAGFFETLLKMLIDPLKGILWMADFVRDLIGRMIGFYTDLLLSIRGLPESIVKFLKGEDTESQKQKNMAASYGVGGWGTLPNSEEKGIGLTNYVINASTKPPSNLPHDLKGVDWFKFQQEHPDLVKHYQAATTTYYRPADLRKMGIPEEALKGAGAPPEKPNSYVPEPGNPFADKDMTNEVAGPGGLSIHTKPAEDIKGSADVEGGLQMGGRVAYDKLYGIYNWMTGGGSTGTEEAPKAARGITAYGPTWVMMGEAGPEETIPSGQTVKGPGAIARGIDLLQDALPTGQPRTDHQPVPQVIIQGDLIKVDKIERSADIDDILWRARTRLEELVPRQSGSYRGGN